MGFGVGEYFVVGHGVPSWLERFHLDHDARLFVGSRDLLRDGYHGELAIIAPEQARESIGERLRQVVDIGPPRVPVAWVVAPLAYLRLRSRQHEGDGHR